MNLPGLLALTPDQYEVIKLPFDGNHLITGPPGSGKTVMAVYRAWMQATAGRSTALITRSNLLSQYTAQLSDRLSGGFRITTFHRWLSDFWNKSFQEDPPNDGTDEWSYDWHRMQIACLRNPPEPLESLVIDEGQNLPSQFYELCAILENNVTVFADGSRSIEERQTTLVDIENELDIDEKTLLLRTNHRTSREIALLADRFRVDAKTANGEFPNRHGEIPHLMHCSSERPFVTQLAQYITSRPECSIGIICRTTELQREIHRQLSGLGLHSSVQSYVSDDMNRRTVDFSTHRTHVVNIASMKGIEFDIVFVPDLDSYADDPTSAVAREQFHVLCMRARTELHFCYHGNREPEIVTDIPPTLLGRRTI
ncbi:AAA family ATPase [Streptomyces sp. NPDC048565]|uniref:AAA family ATPase n=1 Tax=Streptomyces sp. NPDC048565 TaxID=3155266 RepID=UPI0034228492